MYTLYTFYILEVKRAESMKAEYNKKPRRTPSFTTRRRTQSFRKLHNNKIVESLDQLPPVEKQGLLDRKHELQSGGKKAPVRSWKTLYTGKNVNFLIIPYFHFNSCLIVYCHMSVQFIVSVK